MSKPVIIPVTELRTGDIIPDGKGGIKLGKLLDHRDTRERAFAVGPITNRGGSYITWRACGFVTVLR